MCETFSYNNKCRKKISVALGPPTANILTAASDGQTDYNFYYTHIRRTEEDDTYTAKAVW